MTEKWAPWSLVIILVLSSWSISSLHSFTICRESLDLAALWMKTLPNRSIMVRFLLKTTDLAIGEYIVM